jgi:hypothetical protein
VIGPIFVVVLAAFMIWIVLGRRKNAAAYNEALATRSRGPRQSMDERIAEQLAALRGDEPAEADEPRPSFGRRAAPVPSIDGIPESMASIPIVARLFPEVAARAGTPAHIDPPAAPTKPDTPSEDTVKLGTFTLLLDGMLDSFDWSPIDQFLAQYDPEGGWNRITVPGGMGCISGRGLIVMVGHHEPVPPSRMVDMLRRSPWYKGDLDRLTYHKHQLTLMISAPADFEAKRTVAIAATVVMGLLIRAPQAIALVNDTVDTIFDRATMEELVPIVGTGEIPIGLWTWTAPDSLRDGNVSLSTGGLEPFLGYEIETWQAPHPLAYVKEQMSQVIRYLLIEGPVMNHGDTLGKAAGDQPIRCFFGESRANREQPVTAMFIEFADTDQVTPRPDPIPDADEEQPPRPIFGRKGL